MSTKVSPKVELPACVLLLGWQKDPNPVMTHQGIGLVNLGFVREQLLMDIVFHCRGTLPW